MTWKDDIDARFAMIEEDPTSHPRLVFSAPSIDVSDGQVSSIEYAMLV
ncbi:hypothetical protein [Sinorhizobium meliloti]|nr:hypothetical protein [Sinorhizobium meliloti]MDW9928060.1 hypothetical protein [Sinorhizobium meliloti]MDX0964788.1 hypothetical protein [Sinorhizobium medicae]